MTSFEISIDFLSFFSSRSKLAADYWLLVSAVKYFITISIV